MKRNMLLGTVVLMVLVGLLAGCGGNGGNEPKNANNGNEPITANGGNNSEEKEPETLKVAFFQGGYGDSWFKWLKEEFEKEHTNVTVELEGSPKMNEILQPRIKSGSNVPDVAFVDASFMKMWGPSGKLVDFTETYKNEKLPDGKTIEQSADELVNQSMTVLGKIYGVPWAASPRGIVYNVGMFEVNGWEYPTTWEEMETLVGKIKAKGIAPFVYPGKYPGYVQPVGISGYLQYGGLDFLEKLTNTKEEDIPGLYGDNAIKRSYSLIEQMVQDKWFLDGSLALNHTESQMEFLRGNAAMIPNGGWMENEMKDAIPDGFKMRMAPIPPAQDAVVKESIIPVDLLGFGGIPSDSKHIETAKAFLMFASTEEANRKFTELTGSAKAMKYSVDGLDITEFTKSCIEVTSTYKNLTLNYEPQSIGESPGIDAYAALLSGQKTVQQVMDTNVSAAPQKWKDQQKVLNSQ
ncbi:ABC transporter substrate-binding protein [Paenibacillus mendelii]|uniref:ABC transporter substrate-binding protein n=1 Tax=Paenibacillus mendelii TaxID=206163 RepID=A0ABV6JGA6_9BACL|nr:extracellular solute-binding protein [Paenibacillus mendelii]MCQ6557615.1 extracellular solute-binding protein [Paenibacillus mendelii]